MRTALTTLAAMVSAFLLVVALPAYGGTVELYTLRGFVEMLIEKNIVPEHMAGKARELVAFIGSAEPVVNPRAPYTDSVEVSVSQLIEYSKRVYERGDDIRGLVLLAGNTSENDIFPTAVRNCQVIYEIYRGDELLYDSSEKQACEKKEIVSYRLAPGQTRMFEVRHNNLDYPLDRGVYRMLLKYPGYGEGTRTIEIQ